VSIRTEPEKRLINRPADIDEDTYDYGKLDFVRFATEDRKDPPTGKVELRPLDDYSEKQYRGYLERAYKRQRDYAVLIVQFEQLRELVEILSGSAVEDDSEIYSIPVEELKKGLLKKIRSILGIPDRGVSI
jgi:hypothetical protein